MKIYFDPESFYYPTFRAIEDELGKSTAKTFGLLWQIWVDESDTSYLEIDQETLQNGLNRSYSTVRKHINRLEESGYIDAQRNRGKHTTYYFTRLAMTTVQNEHFQFIDWLETQILAKDELKQKQNYLDIERENSDDTKN